MALAKDASPLQLGQSKDARIRQRTTILLPAEPHALRVVATPFNTQLDRNSANVEPSVAVAPFHFESPKADHQPRPIQIYAYSFWRRGAAAGVLGNGQYGGGQSALLMTFAMLRFPKGRIGTRTALTGRAAVSHDRPRERELAAGLRWHPSAAFPAQFSLEQCFRPGRPDALAACVSGGHDGTPLPLGFSLDGYGQAGFVTDEAGGVFADLQLHALRPVVEQRRSRLAAGAGVWGGGQSQIVRLDIGPSVRQPSCGCDADAVGCKLAHPHCWRRKTREWPGPDLVHQFLTPGLYPAVKCR